MRYFFFIAILTVAGCASSPSPLLPPVELKAITNAFKIERVWSLDIGAGASDKYLKLAPLIKGNILYSADHDGLVTAFKIASKDVYWRVNIEQPVGSPLTLYKNNVLLGTSTGQVVALDATTGEKRWVTQLSSEILAAPQVAMDIVVVRCVNGQLFGLNVETGKQVWLHEQRTPALTLRGTSTPVIYGDLVLNAFDNGRLVANNLQSGKMIWQSSIAVPRGRTDLERMVDADADPVIIDNIVYAVAFQGRLVAMQLGSGRIIWTRDLDSYTGMVVDPYRIYLSDSQGLLWALDRTTGATLWKQDALLRRNTTKPTLQKQYLIVGDFNGFLHWFRRDNGKLVARVRLNDEAYSNPALDESEDLVFPKTNDILVEPVLHEDKLFAVDRHGHTEAFLMAYP